MLGTPWQEERTNSSKLSSDLHTYINVIHICVRTIGLVTRGKDFTDRRLPGIKYKFIWKERTWIESLCNKIQHGSSHLESAFNWWKRFKRGKWSFWVDNFIQWEDFSFILLLSSVYGYNFAIIKKAVSYILNFLHLCQKVVSCINMD